MIWRDTFLGMTVGLVLTALSYAVALHYGWVGGIGGFLPIANADPNAPVIVSWCEIIGVVLNYACVVLVSRQSNVNWPLGILAVVFMGLLFYRINLLASMTLSLAYFIPAQFVGWWNWMKGGTGGTELPVSKTIEPFEYILMTVVGIASWFVIVKVYDHFGSSYTPYDVTILMLSVIAQYLCNQKKPISWLFWAAVNITSIYVYGSSGAYLLAFQYALFLCNVLYGYTMWYKDVHKKSILYHFGR
jgi:nicotinamide mononucleotide transporter